MNDHLASGDVEVQRSTIPADDRGVDITVKKMVEMAQGVYGGRSAKIRALAINIVNAAGVRVKGTADAENAVSLQVALRAKGLHLTESKEFVVRDETARLSIKKVKTKPLAIFIRQFATLIQSGVTVIKGLDVLYLQAEDKNLKTIIGRIYEGVGHYYLHAATDWSDYADGMLATLSAEPLLANTAPGFAPRPESRPLTKFERRGTRLGHPVFDLLFTRK